MHAQSPSNAQKCMLNDHFQHLSEDDNSTAPLRLFQHASKNFQSNRSQHKIHLVQT